MSTTKITEGLPPASLGTIVQEGIHDSTVEGSSQITTGLPIMSEGKFKAVSEYFNDTKFADLFAKMEMFIVRKDFPNIAEIRIENRPRYFRIKNQSIIEKAKDSLFSGETLSEDEKKLFSKIKKQLIYSQIICDIPKNHVNMFIEKARKQPGYHNAFQVFSPRGKNYMRIAVNYIPNEKAKEHND